MRAPLLLCLCCTALACATAAPMPDRAADEAALISADTDFAKDSLARGGPAWVDRFSRDGVLLGDGQLVPSSKVGAVMQGALGQPGHELRWSPDEAHASGELGYTIGKYTALQDGKEQSRGRYLTIWRREQGAWKIVLDTGSEAPAPAR